MGFRVICISHAEEAGGEAIGHAVAQQLGFRYVDEEIISKAARVAQVDPALVAAAERRQPLLQRLFDAIATATAIGSPLAMASGLPIDTGPYSSLVRGASDDLRILIRAAVLDVGKTGDAVIVAHAASLALAGKPGVLRVLITAPEQTRIRRLSESRALSESDAADVITKSDAGRQHYLQTFYDIEEELPTHYDMVLSTEVLTSGQVTALIVSAARG